MSYPVQTRLTLGLMAALLAVALLMAEYIGFSRVTLAVGLIALLASVSAGYLIWCTEPRYTFTLAIVLAPFAGNWQQLGIPGQLAPERLLLAGGILTVLLRGPGIRDRPKLRLEAAHWMLALVAVYAASSAFFSGTLFQNAPGIRLVETFGIFPFLIFALGPVVFPTDRERSTLLKGFVALATYLSLTTMFEITGPKSLVFPHYILDPNYGIHFGYGRGPFADAVANGFGLYVCAIACLIAIRLWRSSAWRIFAGVVAVLCLVDTMLTLERSVWISTVAASVIALLAIRSARRLLVPIILVGAVSISAALLFIPGLATKVTTRATDQATVWDRQNLQRTALNMIEARPLFGFGWYRYLERNRPYLQQSPNIPLTATTENLHSVVLTYAVELGLVGAALWIVAVLMGVGGGLLTRGPPDLEPWRAGLLALFVFFAIQGNFVPPTVFQNLGLWLWAGVVWATRYTADQQRAA
jgi:putative inorganic carbon (HCO3(-)) transporter